MTALLLGYLVLGYGWVLALLGYAVVMLRRPS